MYVNEKIRVDNIIFHVDDLYKNLSTYLEETGRHLLSLIDKDTRISEICFIIPKGRMGCKLISLKEKDNGLPGICQNYRLDCPKSEDCIARQNTDIKTGKEIFINQ